MTWSDYTGRGVSVRPSEAETRRFGLSVARVDIGTSSADEVARALAAERAEVLIVRFDASRRDLADVLASSGRLVLPAGTLTYWEHSLSDVEQPPSDAPLDVVPLASLGPQGPEVVRQLVSDSFAAYPNHYVVNPLFDPELVAEGYVEWASSRVNDDGGSVLVLRDAGVPIGLATLVTGAGEWEVELAGLIASAQGRGAYRVLLASCIAHTRGGGARRLVISTQADNVRPQRAWARAGFVPFAAIETVHLTDRSDVAK